MNVHYQVDSSLSKYNIKEALHNAFVNNVVLYFLETYLYLFIIFVPVHIFFYLHFYANKGFIYYLLLITIIFQFILICLQ